MNTQLYLDGLLNPAHIFWGENAGSSKKPYLADSRQLVRHGLALFTFKNHHRLTGIEAIRLAGQRDNLDSIEELV